MATVRELPAMAKLYDPADKILTCAYSLIPEGRAECDHSSRKNVTSKTYCESCQLYEARSEVRE